MLRMWITIAVLYFFVIAKDMCHEVCLSWNLYSDQLQLTCNMKENISEVVIIDNFGTHLLSCSFSSKEYNCQRLHDGVLFVNYSNAQLTLIIQRNQITDYDGQWTCEVDSEETRANVSSFSGIEEDTFVDLEVTTSFNKTLHSTYVELRCFSCRDPYGFHAEFLLDNKTVDSLTYDQFSSTCFHENGICRPEICICSSKNRFTRKLRIDLSTPKFFSCKMMFIDAYTGSKLFKTAGIYYDGKDFNPVTTLTKIIKPGNFSSGISPTLVSTPSSTTPTMCHDSTNSKALQFIYLVIGIVTGIVLQSCVVQCIWRIKRKLPPKNEKKTIEDSKIEESEVELLVLRDDEIAVDTKSDIRRLPIVNKDQEMDYQRYPSELQFLYFITGFVLSCLIQFNLSIKRRRRYAPQNTESEMAYPMEGYVFEIVSQIIQQLWKMYMDEKILKETYPRSRRQRKW